MLWRGSSLVIGNHARESRFYPVSMLGRQLTLGRCTTGTVNHISVCCTEGRNEDVKLFTHRSSSSINKSWSKATWTALRLASGQRRDSLYMGRYYGTNSIEYPENDIFLLSLSFQPKKIFMVITCLLRWRDTSLLSTKKKKKREASIIITLPVGFFL